MVRRLKGRGQRTRLTVCAVASMSAFVVHQLATRIDGCDHRVGVAIMIGALDLDEHAQEQLEVASGRPSRLAGLCSHQQWSAQR